MMGVVMLRSTEVAAIGKHDPWAAFGLFVLCVVIAVVVCRYEDWRK